MMGIIKELDHDLINKIAAGEVIERPASCVKELIENSLDAAATSIVVELVDGGKSYIRVSDNGCGMVQEDVLLCTKKHTTSKIHSVDDLFRIGTLGFRGEALSSMAAVAHLEVTSKTRDDLTGTKISLEQGIIVEQRDVGSPPGTTIELFELFSTIPVRKNYLKDAATEFRHCVDIVQQYALAQPKISFKLINNTAIVFTAPASQDPLGKIVALFGGDFARELIPLTSQDPAVTLSGFIGKPSINRADKNTMYFFVNGRSVKNKILYDAVCNAYDTLLNTQRFPVCILSLQIPMEKIDVNVHPNKIVIKIEDEEHVAHCVTRIVRNTLLSANLVPRADTTIIAKETQQIFLEKKEKRESTQIPEDAEPSLDPTLPQTNIIRILRSLSVRPHELEEFKYRPLDVVQTQQQELVEEPQPSQEHTMSEFSETASAPSPFVLHDNTEPISFKILGTVHKTYVLIEQLNGLRILDQHAVEERILYEKFKRRYAEKTLIKQSLLEALQLELSPRDVQTANEFKPTLEELGFTFDDFGGNTILLRTMPSILGKQQGVELFTKTVGLLQQEGLPQNPVEKLTDLFLKTMGCRAAIKAGDTVHPREIRKLLEELEMCEQPYTCPHGRPTMIDITIADLEKLFNRERGYESKI